MSFIVTVRIEMVSVRTSAWDKVAWNNCFYSSNCLQQKCNIICSARTNRPASVSNRSKKSQETILSAPVYGHLFTQLLVNTVTTKLRDIKP